jgi:lipopolysaccharide transport system permease protein
MSLPASGPASANATRRPLAAFAATLWRNRALVWEMTMRDLKGAHAGHGLGSLWVYLQPLVIVGTYMTIFGLIIGSKLDVSALPGDYTSYILVGMTPWLLMANVLGRAPGVFISNANLVKQVVFPIEALPFASVLAAFMIFAPSFALVIAYKATLGGGLSPMIALGPLVVALHAALSLGIVLMLSVTTPFLRDIREFVTVYTSISMYFTPAIYLPEWAPQALRPLLFLNPFSYVVWVYQDVMFFGRFEHPLAWAVFAAMAVGALAGGVVVFRKVRPYLGNVL